MEFTVASLLKIKPSLDNLLNSQIKNVRASYRVSKFMKKVLKELEDFEDSRSRYIVEHGSKGPDGRSEIDPESPQFRKFVVDMEALMLEKVDIQVMKISVDDIQGTKLTVGDLINLDFLIEDEEQSSVN